MSAKSFIAFLLCCAGDQESNEVAFVQVMDLQLLWELWMLRWDTYVCDEHLQRMKRIQVMWIG